MTTLTRWSLVVLVACGSRPPPLEVAAPAPTPAVSADAAAADDLAAPTQNMCNAAPEPPQDRYGGSGARRRERNTEDVCAVADNNLERAQKEVTGLPAPVAGPARVAWDKKSKPLRLDLIDRRFALTPDEKSKLMRDGFVVPARLAQSSYAWAYHEIYQSQLPIYVTVDSIMNAVYATHDRLVGDLERTELAPLVTAIVKSLHCALPSAAARFPRETVQDLDLYLTVARRLLEGGEVASALADAGVDRQAGAIVAKALAATSMDAVEVFGRARAIDFTQFTPRGHYTKELAPYFRGAMWLSRTEWNLVSRSSRSSHPPWLRVDPRETPREVLDAFALAELVVGAGQADRLATFERAYGLLAGRREDVSVKELVALQKQAGIIDLKADGAADKLIAAIGKNFQRTARIHPMPEGSTNLPAIATLLGPRIVPDTVALRPLAHSEVIGRHHIRGGDLAYVAGLDRGLEHLKADLARYPSLRGQLDVARKALADAPRTDDLYTAWLDAIRALAAPPRGQVPSFMETPQYADMRVSSAVAAFAQIRHNHVLIAGQAYGEGGCEIPDGFVEPAVEVYEALARYADRGAAALSPFTTVKKGKKENAHDYFVRFGKLMKILATISRYELANQPLPRAALDWLAMVTEILPFGSDGRPTYTGWYFDLFDTRDNAIAAPDLIADFFTSPVEGISYAGVGEPRIGVFIVDTGGVPRAVVGPVAHAYEHVGPIGRRLDDTAARSLPAATKSAPWAAAYSVAAPPDPSFDARVGFYTELEGGGASVDMNYLMLNAPRALGPMTIELLDHHRVPLHKKVVNIVAGMNKIDMRRPKRADGKDDEHEFWPHIIHFQLGNWHGYGELSCMNGCRPWGWGTMAPKAPTYE